MSTDDKFEKIVNAPAWKKELNISFSTDRYAVRIESIAYLPRQTAIIASHNHILYKIRYFHTGSGIVGINGVNFPVEPDTILIISPFVQHNQIHSQTSSAEEYTVFLEINPIHNRRGCEDNEMIYKDLDHIFDILVKEKYYLGKDVCHAGQCMMRIYQQLKMNCDCINLSRLWLELMQMIVSSAENIAALPMYDVVKTPLIPDEQRKSILDSIFRTYHEELSQESVAKMLGISVRHLNRIMMRLYKMTFKQKYNQSRMELAVTLLEEAESLSVEEISRKLNFGSDVYFSKCFKGFFGMTPKEYRRAKKCR